MKKQNPFMLIPKNEHAALRIRVERLLRGDRRPEDVSALFLAMRDYSGGRECVKEIGNFIAHRGERKVGITTREVTDFFRTLRFHLDYPVQDRRLDLLDLPSNISDLLVSAFRRTPNDSIKQQLNLNRKAAEKQLSDLRTRLFSDAQGKIALTFPNDADRSLLNCTLGHFNAYPAFTDLQLIEEFAACLHANDLLTNAELKTFRSLRQFVGLLAVANMHLCVIDLGDGTTAELAAGMAKSKEVVAVGASSEFFGHRPNNEPVRIGSDFFMTDTKISDGAADDLLPNLMERPAWKCHVELSATSGKLVRLA